MVRKVSLPAAVSRWEAMSRAQQLTAVRLVCGSKGRALMKKFDGTLAVGAGYKKSANAVSEHVCLGLLVRRKGIKGVTRPVPKRIEFDVLVDGRKVRLSIPTDVEELADGAPHGVNLADGVHAFNRDDKSEGVSGAACCLVADSNAPPNLFVLSCRHVLALSILTSGCQAFNASDVADAAMTTRLGGLYASLPMASDGQPYLDAAISLVTPGADVNWIGPDGVSPVAVDPGVVHPQNCNAYTPRGILPAPFVKEWAKIPLSYPNCGDVVIEVAYQFQAATQPGDSGSPLMTSDGVLHAMHFWGDPAQQLAFAIPAFALFRQGQFPVDFNLA